MIIIFFKLEHVKDNRQIFLVYFFIPVSIWWILTVKLFNRLTKALKHSPDLLLGDFFGFFTQLINMILNRTSLQWKHMKCIFPNAPQTMSKTIQYPLHGTIFYDMCVIFWIQLVSFMLCALLLNNDHHDNEFMIK